MSSYLEWNILLAVLAAELVRFHMCCLQTKWDLGGFVFACLIQTLTDGNATQTHHRTQASLWSITLFVVTFDEIHVCNYSFQTLNGKRQRAVKRCVLFLHRLCYRPVVLKWWVVVTDRRGKSLVNIINKIKIIV